MIFILLIKKQITKTHVTIIFIIFFLDFYTFSPEKQQKEENQPFDQC